MSGFYITLPSNSSMDQYPNNTKASFRTQLAKPVILNQDYEVALVEVNYSSNIKTFLGNFIVYHYYNNIIYGYMLYMQSHGLCLI